MIQSMTGYGKTVLQLPTKKVTIEIKSLNSKNLDLNVRIPSYYKEKELAVRKKLASALVRGKVDFSIYVEMTAEETSTTLNHGVVKQYLQQLRNIVETEASNEVELLKQDSSKKIAFIGDGNSVTMSAVDSKTSTADNYNTVVAEGISTDPFNMIIKTDNLKLVPADYEVTLSSKGMAHFKSSRVQYWVAIETR